MIDEDEKRVDVAGPLALVKCDGFGDWYLIERAEHDGREWLEKAEHGHRFMRSARISDADVEGTREEMIKLGEAIRSKSSYRAKRCAVSVVAEESAWLWSPRNSQVIAVVPLVVAETLAVELLALRAK
jgi:hypothetical protein